jgi:hypothetical protein
MPPKLN